MSFLSASTIALILLGLKYAGSYLFLFQPLPSLVSGVVKNDFSFPNMFIISFLINNYPTKAIVFRQATNSKVSESLIVEYSVLEW